MRIIIDMRGIQIAFHKRGGVLPSLRLLRSFISNRESHEVSLILSGGLPQSIEPISVEFEDLVSKGNMRIAHVPGLVEATADSKNWQRSVMSFIHDAVIDDTHADVVLLAQCDSPTDLATLSMAAPLPISMVMGQRDSAKTSWGLLASQMAKAPPNSSTKTDSSTPQTKPRLAFVSPLPPQRSGVADYALELLQHLVRHYDVDVVALHALDPIVSADVRFTVRSIEWLRGQASSELRVIYHFGNSPFHHALFDSLNLVPGVVVLHDFFLSDVQLYREVHELKHAWSSALYDSHGYQALIERFDPNLRDAARIKYPANLEVLQQAQGVIVHSDHPMQLTEKWYGKCSPSHWAKIPLMRTPQLSIDRVTSRKLFGYQPDEFAIASFGLIGPNKQSLSILRAWLASDLARDARCKLVFVGQNDEGSYGKSLSDLIHSSGLSGRITITGWVDELHYRNHLEAVDLAVQLRANSRGETSAAVLDCMNYGLATIVNASAAMAELPTDATICLEEDFSEGDLTAALETAWRERHALTTLGARAKHYVHTHHAPSACAERYFESIERFHTQAWRGRQGVIQKIAQLPRSEPNPAEYISAAQALADSLAYPVRQRQLLVDVSAVCRNDIKTGIQRVVRALTNRLLRSPPPGFRIEPVFLSDEGGRWHYRYARKWACRSLELPPTGLLDEAIEYASGDILLVADYTGNLTVMADSAGIFLRLKQAGVSLQFVIYDLLPTLMPEVFPPGLHNFIEWLQTVSRVADKVHCISNTVAVDLHEWVQLNPSQRHKPISIHWFHLGADVETSVPTLGLPPNFESVISQLAEAPTFVMVGTIEPRKGYAQALAAFSQLWDAGVVVNLVIVGHEGWQGMPDSERRDIPETVSALSRSPHAGERLFWLNGVSDEYLELVYQASDCLLTASKGEGFGLPLIEAARRRLPILARDLPIFREVAGEYAEYFAGFEPTALAAAVIQWLEQHASGSVVHSEGMPTRTWADSAQQLLSQVIPELQAHA